MDEKQLSILQIQKVLGVSYPTALNWAKERGTKVTEHGRDKWYVPASAVQTELSNRSRKVRKAQAELELVLFSNGQS